MEGADCSSDERELEEAWRKFGCNGAQVQLDLDSDDRAAGFALDRRLLYSLLEVAAQYFTLCRVPWLSEKAVIRS